MRGGPLLAFLPALVAAAALGVAAWAGLLEPAQVRASFASLGPWAGPALVLALAVATLALAPTSPLSVACGFLLGPWYGFGVAWLGAFLGGAAAYAVGRGARGPVRAWLEKRAGRAIRALDGQPFGAALVARMLPLPHGPVSYGFALAGTPARPYLAGTALGLLPMAAVLAAAGTAVTDLAWLRDPAAWALLAGSGLAIAAGVAVQRRMARAARVAQAVPAAEAAP